MKANGVFSGGGVKGIAFVGAVKVCEELGYRWNRLAGTSSGAIVAALLAAGYTAEELQRLLTSLDYKKITQSGLWDRVPLGRAIRLLWKKGLYPATYLEWWLDQQLAKKKAVTFADLPDQKLKVIASDLTTGKIICLPDDGSRYGLDAGSLRISRAVRMSISLPFFFDPVLLKNRHGKHFIVDGAVVSNFPVWIFDEHQGSPPKIPTFGFLLRSRPEEQGHEIKGPVSMLKAVISTMLEQQDMKYVRNLDAVRTIFIPTPGVHATDFHLSEGKQRELLRWGEEAARKFFATWDFDRYLALCGKGGK